MQSFAVLCFATMLAGTAALGNPVSSADVLAKIHPGHPRLMLTPATVAAIKSNLTSDPWLNARYEKQKRSADDLLTKPPCIYDAKGGDGLLDISREVLKRVSTLALIYRLEGDKKYLDRCWAELNAVAGFPDWNPRHFLSTAEMTAAVAIGYDWLFDSWTDAQRQTLRQAIIERGLKPGLFYYQVFPSKWALKTDNWNTVCNGGMALGALAIANKSPEIAGHILSLGLASVPSSLKQFGPDGAWGEGPMYWGYTTLYESMYLDSLQTACGTDFGLGDIAGVRLGGWFPTYLNGPAAGAFNFADAEEDHEPRAGPQLLWMARRFGEPRYAQYQIEHPGTGRVQALELIWGAGVERKSWQSIERDKYFRGVEVATMRDSWENLDGWFLGIKGGSNTINHSHLDVGSFVLEAKGVRWAVALGPDDYDLPGYFDEEGPRWAYYRLRAEGQNTLVVNPGPGPDQAIAGFGKITRFTPGPLGVELSIDLSGAYPAADQVTRSVSFVRGKRVEIRDQLKLKQAGDVWWFLQTRATAQLSGDGRTVTLREAGQTLSLSMAEPASCKFQLGPAKPLSTSPHPAGQAGNKGVTRIAIHLANVQQTAIDVVFQ